MRDAFDGSALYRMNTVFKLGYQAWLLLAIAAALRAAVGGRVAAARARWARLGGGRARSLLAARRSSTRTRAPTRARAASRTRRRSTGCGWLRRRAPGDPGAIDWLREHAPGDAVVLEAVGDDYSAFGHARISTFTGLPTVIGWPGHELQWEHDPGTRARRRRALYTTPDARRRARAARPLRRSATSSSGRSSAPTTATPGVAKWDQLGRRVFDRDGTTVWRAQALSARAAHVEPLGHPARRVPRLALREPAPPVAGRHLAVVAHPPDAERELAAVVAGERRLQARRGAPR